MTRDLILEKQWKTRFDDYQKSGISIKSWCTKNGLKSSTFQYWIKRFRAPDKKVSAEETQFAEVILESESTTNKSTTIKEGKIYLSYGSYTIGIEDCFNPVTLAELLKVLRRL